MGCLELSQVDSSRERLPEVRVRDADLYSRSYMLHMLFLHLANGPAVIITILSGRKSYCLIVFPLKWFVCFLLGKCGSCRFGAYVRSVWMAWSPVASMSDHVVWFLRGPVSVHMWASWTKMLKTLGLLTGCNVILWQKCVFSRDMQRKKQYYYFIYRVEIPPSLPASLCSISICNAHVFSHGAFFLISLSAETCSWVFLFVF